MSAKDIIDLPITSAQEGMDAAWKGQANRQVARTLSNQDSSRSHSVFTLFIHKTTRASGMEDFLEDFKLSIVDLAGSERAKKTKTDGARMKEAANINKSLMTLGQCLETLRWNQQHPAATKMIPYRDSKLTMLLSEFLVFSGFVSMIVNANPTMVDLEETLQALKYSAIARDITIRTKLDTRRPKRIREEEAPAQSKRAREDAMADDEDEECCDVEELRGEVKDLREELEAVMASHAREVEQMERDTLHQLRRQREDLEAVFEAKLRALQKEAMHSPGASSSGSGGSDSDMDEDDREALLELKQQSRSWLINHVLSLRTKEDSAKHVIAELRLRLQNATEAKADLSSQLEAARGEAEAAEERWRAAMARARMSSSESAGRRLASELVADWVEDKGGEEAAESVEGTVSDILDDLENLLSEPLRRGLRGDLHRSVLSLRRQASRRSMDFRSQVAAEAQRAAAAEQQGKEYEEITKFYEQKIDESEERHRGAFARLQDRVNKETAVVQELTGRVHRLEAELAESQLEAKDGAGRIAELQGKLEEAKKEHSEKLKEVECQLRSDLRFERDTLQKQLEMEELNVQELTKQVEIHRKRAQDLMDAAIRNHERNGGTALHAKARKINKTISSPYDLLEHSSRSAMFGSVGCGRPAQQRPSVLHMADEGGFGGAPPPSFSKAAREVSFAETLETEEFYNFVEAEGEPDVLTFYLKVEEYKRLQKAQDRLNLSRDIVETFLSSDAPSPIALDSMLKAQVENELLGCAHPSATVFDALQLAARESLDSLYCRHCVSRSGENDHPSASAGLESASSSSLRGRHTRNASRSSLQSQLTTALDDSALNISSVVLEDHEVDAQEEAGGAAATGVARKAFDHLHRISSDANTPCDPETGRLSWGGSHVDDTEDLTEMSPPKSSKKRGLLKRGAKFAKSILKGATPSKPHHNENVVASPLKQFWESTFNDENIEHASGGKESKRGRKGRKEASQPKLNGANTPVARRTRSSMAVQ